MQKTSRWRALRPLVLALLMLVSVEVILQARAHVRTGQSVFAALTGETTYRQDEVTGLMLFRPKAVIKGSTMEISSNSWGLRSAELDAMPRAGELRMAILGASSVQGTYAPTNAHTAAALLEEQVSKVRAPVSVVNAGVAGLTVEQQVVLLRKRLIPAGVKIVYWYPGANDIYCRRPESKNSPVWRPKLPTLPDWVLSRKLIVSNTPFLKSAAVSSGTSNGVPSLDAEKIAAALDVGIGAARDAGVNLRLATIARSFDGAQPLELRNQRAASALFFRPCFTADELIVFVEKLNGLIRERGQAHGVPVVEVGAAMSGNTGLFGDATHFSVQGERRLADLLFFDFNFSSATAGH